MAAEDFFSRWSQRKSQTDQAGSDQSPGGMGEGTDVTPAAAPAPEESLPPPTIDDVANLTPDSDFSRFVKSDVDETVKRSALKKLFTNPHFNVMDGLDVYIDDYNKFTPLTPALLASLNHAKDLLNPPGLKKPDADSSEVREAAAVPMEMLSSQEEAANAAPHEAAPNDAGAVESAEASNLDLDTEITEIEAETNLPNTHGRTAERMSDDQNKATSSPQGDS